MVITTSYPNALYACLGVQSTADSAQSGRSVLPLGPHVRHPGGLRLAALGLAAEHGAGTCALGDVQAVPTAIAVSQRDVPSDLEELELVTRLRHKGRSLMVTTMDGFRPGDREQRLVSGTITWTVLPPAPTASKPATATFAAGHADLLAVAGVTTTGNVTAIAGADAGTAGPGGVLHAGALQALAEEAALVALATLANVSDCANVTDATFHFVRAARTGPFVGHVQTHSSGDVEVAVHDEGGTGKLCVLAICKSARGSRR